TTSILPSFFSHATPTTEISALSLHDALPISSRIRQFGTETRGRERNAVADANVSGCQPSSRISASSASRTEMSSSTTKTIGVCRSEEHTSELQSLTNLVCRLLLEKKKTPSTP